MSVYIKGMEMPNTCEECNLESFCDRWIDARKMCGEWKPGVKATIRHPECPLIEIPSHGDLIDKKTVIDNLCKILTNAKPPANYPNWNDAIIAVMTAPTIIPADDPKGERA